MPAKTDNVPQNKGSDTNAFVHDYLADWDDEDDPFASPSPPPAAGTAGKNDKKRKEPDTLGIDEQIDLKKKPRIPRVKLDESRLLSEKGIPGLRKRAPKLKLKGKGHEFSDAARLLSFYQEWLDDLFPKATFLDALAMVEKAGHKTIMRNERLRWIDESKPRPAASAEDEDDPFGPAIESAPPQQPSRIAPVFEKAAAGDRGGDWQGTPDVPCDDDLFGDEDIFNSTPKAQRRRQVAIGGGAGADVPDEDDLEALMAEAEANGTTTRAKETSRAPVFGSIFGGGGVKTAIPTAQPSGEPDEDELDAMMAEAEAEAAPSRATPTSIFGGSRPNETVSTGDDDEDLDALMAEGELQVAPAPPKVTECNQEMPAPSPNPEGEKGKQVEAPSGELHDDDDLDTLMAEAEGLATGAAGGSTSTFKPTGEKMKDQSFEDDEEAMAEMDGLW